MKFKNFSSQGGIEG